MQENKQTDIFDRIMDVKLMKPFRPLYEKHKEVLLYLLFGFLTFLVSIISYSVCNVSMGINELVANVISWILAVLFAYVTNRIWVFQSRVRERNAVLREIVSFFGGRLGTLIIEEAIIFVFITKMGFNSVLVKVLAQVVVIILNYIISKLWVFKKNKKVLFL